MRIAAAERATRHKKTKQIKMLTAARAATIVGLIMRLLKSLLLASAAGLLAVSAAQAADLPTKKAAPAAAAPNCYASFWSWLDSTAADCPLSAYGITLYGTIDMGGGYETNAGRFNKDYPQGVQELINKWNNGARWQAVPNGLSQSNVGIKIKEQIAPNWYVIGDVNTGFDPYSLRFADGPRSLVDNDNTGAASNLGSQTSNGDSSRTRWDNTRAYLGLSNTTFGTLTVGRQYAFSNDLASNYDPFGGSYAFSMIGNSSTFVGGTGDTETARYNTSVKYQVTYNGFRAGALAQIGGWSDGNGAREAYQADIGADIGGFSADAIYAYAKDAVALSAYTSGAPTPDTLKATLADINAGVIAAKYKWQALTVYGGYEYARLSTPSDFGDYFPSATATSGNTYTLNGGYPAVVQQNIYANPKDLQVVWVGGKYGILSNLDFVAGYYYAWQNDYSLLGKSSKTGGPNKYQGTAACGPNTTSAITGSAPQGSSYSTCAGHEDAVSAMLDWRPVKRVDLYTGVMYSQVAGGMANGFIHSNNTAYTGGVRINF
jgi:predicted porin